MRKTSATSRLKPFIFTRRLARDTAGDTATALVVLLFLYAAVDLVEVNAMAGASASGLMYTYFFKLPTVSALLLPFALALGVSLRYARLRQTGEWEAMQSVGISPRTTYKRLLSVSAGAILIGAALSLYFGPLGTAHFEARLRRTAAASTPGCEESWTKQHFGFARFNCVGRADTLIELDGRGRPISRYALLQNETGGDTAAVWTAAGWYADATGHRAFETELTKPLTAPSVNNLWGQSLTVAALERALSDAGKMGLSQDALRAERSLRVAAILACILVPAVVLALLFVRETARTGRAVMVGIVITAAYWSMCAVAWNGVSAGLWRETWLSCGVPAAFLLTSVMGYIWFTLQKQRESEGISDRR